MKYLKNYVKREASCLTDSCHFEKVATVDDFPVFFGVTDSPQEEDLYAKMEWFIEKTTGLIQLNNLIPLEVLYQSQHAYGFGETWENHYREFSKFMLKAKPKNVLEIGAGQGRIAQICTEDTLISKWTIIEPNPTFKETTKIKVIQGFFDENSNIDGEFDTYCFSHVLEHAYNPKEFLSAICKKMKFNDNLIFSYPNLKAWLSKKFTNSLNFEHTIFLTDNHLNTLLNNLGFEIIEKKNYLEHSHFYHVKKYSENIAIKTYENLTLENTTLLKDFIYYHINEVAILNDLIDNNKDGKYFLFGAHIFSQYLKVFGLKTEKIISIIDNSKEKMGKRLYGTSLFVSSPHILANYVKPIIILRAGPYNEEIKKQILNEINKDAIFI
jgi:2-polyprenyl-3-methyl-5-hydroxy-6-metoxy-1,4-benzoquinol methylase